MSRAFHGMRDPRLQVPVARLDAVAVALVVLLAAAGPLLSGFRQEAKLLPGDGDADTWFAASVAMDGATVVVGAEGDSDHGASKCGSAYVFVREALAWTQQARLLADDGVAGDRLGTSVAIEGETIVAGAQRDDSNGWDSGSAYIFVREGAAWMQQAKLLADDGAAYDYFGESVAIEGDTVVVGALYDDDNDEDSGSAYVFVREGTTWMQQAKLQPDDGAMYQVFGTSVAIDGDTVVVGARGDGDNGVYSGSAYIFLREGTTWMQQAKLVADDGNAHDNLGHSVAVDGDAVVVGAPGDDDNGNESGSAYVFVRWGTAWTQQAKLVAKDGRGYDQFGYSVAIDGDTVSVGAVTDDDNGAASGSTYVFARGGTTWTQRAKLLADDGAESDYFGSSVALAGDTVVVGAYGDDDNGSDSGSAYVYEAMVVYLPLVTRRE